MRWMTSSRIASGTRTTTPRYGVATRASPCSSRNGWRRSLPAHDRTQRLRGRMLGTEGAPVAARPHRSDTLERGLAYLGRTQHADGSWHGDYGGPMFLLPLYVATCHVAHLGIDAAEQRE